MTETASSMPSAVSLRLQSEVQQAIERGLKGLENYTRRPPPVGQTPKDVLISRGTLALYHYRPMVDDVYRVPILIVMATTNRGYIFDLAPGQSFVEFMLKRGYDVYLVDWRPPRADESALRIDDYVENFIPSCIRAVQQDSGCDEVSLIGYCFGGVLSTLYASLNQDGPLKNLVCFTTPINFHGMTIFSKLSDRTVFNPDHLLDHSGNLPPETIAASFDMLRPVSRTINQINLWRNIWNDQYVESYRRMQRFGDEMLPLAGEYFKQTVRDLLWDNKLHNDTMTIGDKPASIRNIRIPLFHAVAEHDHIVPTEASRHLIERVASKDKESVVLKGGHVSLIAGPNAVKRLWPRLDAWLQTRSV
jgi:polyhydroxyalkanoate synthase subunit PhaC